MRLRKIELTNFKGCRNTTKIDIDEGMTGIVGRDDFGKSAIPETLATFFETEGVKAGRNDMNYFNLRESANRFGIVCEFDDLSESIIIDERMQATLASEHLLNRDDNFKVVKSFKATAMGRPE